MDLILRRARSFASDAAKRSQELAVEAAKLSQEIAVVTAKRSREIAVEATKKADQLKSLAGEITPSIAAVASRNFTSAPTEEELEEYGVSGELREFVNGLTIKTFEDFPVQDSDLPGLADGASTSPGTDVSNTRQDLTEWQERHALLVLKAVPEISQFRYALCPRHMKESQFWKIYFTIVKSHITPYMAHINKNAIAVKSADDAAVACGEGVNDQSMNSSGALSMDCDESEAPQRAIITNTDELDAYLTGALGSGDEGPDDDDFDADFDKLVNSTALDSDVEEEGGHVTKLAVSSTKTAVPSDGSSDGEIVEVPSDFDSHIQPSKADESGL